MDEDSNDGVNTPGVNKKVLSIRKALNCLLDLEEKEKRKKQKKKYKRKTNTKKLKKKKTSGF